MTKPTKIYVDDASRMLRYDVLSKQYETVFDVAPTFGADKTVWQMHSSDDDKVHSATLRTNTTWEMLGCVVYHEDTRQFQHFPKIADNRLSEFLGSHNMDRSTPAPQHFAHDNARADLPPSQQYACGTGASRLNAVWASGVVCFTLDGSLRVLVVAPVMTDLHAPGG